MPRFLFAVIIILVFVACGVVVYLATVRSVTPLPNVSQVTSQYDPTVPPKINTETVISNLDHPWDIAFLPDGKALFTQRSGSINSINGASYISIAKVDDVVATGEGGLTGLAIDPGFVNNRWIYTCYNTASDIRVVRWKIIGDLGGVADKQPIVTGMPVSSGGRHSGCRMAFDKEAVLWIGTGDTAKGSAPQDPKSLGGKVLRVDRNGNPINGNLGAPFDPRIYSYGHRNLQGIAFLDVPRGDIIGYSAEHGSYIDDEVNPLKKGNFGWGPDAAYTEQGIPMTDKKKFPDAIEPSWKSGEPTQAPSGLTEVKGEQWQSWNGTLAMAMLKAQHLKILTLNDNGQVVKEEKILENKGRLRDVQQAPDGSLYVSTDNGQNKDEIIRLTPQY